VPRLKQPYQPPYGDVTHKTFVEQGYSVPKRDSGYRAVMHGVFVLRGTFDRAVNVCSLLLFFFVLFFQG
jgi:hypothetical protein